MFFTSENQTLYLKSWTYNVCLIISELARIIENHGGIVKPNRAGFIVNRSIIEKARERRQNAEILTNMLKEKDFTKVQRAKIERAVEGFNREADEIETIKNDPVKVEHMTYLSFVLDGVYYYYEVNENFLFDFYYTKTPIINGVYSRDAVLNTAKKEWLYDCFFAPDCAKADLIEAANLIFNELLSADNSQIVRDSYRTRVPNRYNDGYHYETIYAPERTERADWINKTGDK